jgi:hypothetical protein
MDDENTQWDLSEFREDELEPTPFGGVRPTLAALIERNPELRASVHDGGHHSRAPNFDSGIGGGRKSKSADPSFGQP